MRRIRIGIIGGNAWSEWGILPVLFGPDASAPPDEGAWWSRRPTASAGIRWQAPYRAEVLALCESDEEKRARIAATYRIAAQYSDVQTMLRENSLDAIFCEDASSQNLPELVAAMARAGAKSLWLGGAPAPTAAEALELAHWAAAYGVRVWCARNVRRAAAHRAALQLVKRGEIGDVTALSLRWSTPFCPAPDADCAARAATFAALDLLLACAGGTPVNCLLSEAKSTSHLWLQFAGGATATAIFASGDNWNSPLPRLEICGTQGRFLVCEAGRRMGFFQPHEAARWIEPPGLAAHISAANVNGLAEDIKAFLGECASQESKPDNADWLEVARVLASGEAALRARETNQVAQVERLHFPDNQNPNNNNTRSASTPAATAPLTLPLAL